MALILMALVALLVAQVPDAGISPEDATSRELARLRAAGFPLVDYHTHLKEGLKLEDVLRRSRDYGIKAGIAVNGVCRFL